MRYVCNVWTESEDSSGIKTEAKLLELAGEYRFVEVAYPRITFMRSAEILEAAGLPMVETPYSPQRFAVISSTFNRLVNAGLLVHDGDPALRAQVLAATSKDSETGWRYVQSPRCAALFALANALHQASSVEEDMRIILPESAGMTTPDRKEPRMGRSSARLKLRMKLDTGSTSAGQTRM